LRKLLSLGKINQEINSVEKIIIPVETEDFLEKKTDLEEVNNPIMEVRRQMVKDPTLVDIEVVEGPTLVDIEAVEDLALADIEAVEDPTLADIEAVDNQNILKKEILNLLEQENLSLQAAVKMGKRQIIRAEEKIITVQTVKIATNKTELSFIKQ
jgi:hypothetical protein